MAFECNVLAMKKNLIMLFVDNLYHATNMCVIKYAEIKSVSAFFSVYLSCNISGCFIHYYILKGVSKKLNWVVRAQTLSNCFLKLKYLKYHNNISKIKMHFKILHFLKKWHFNFKKYFLLNVKFWTDCFHWTWVVLRDKLNLI